MCKRDSGDKVASGCESRSPSLKTVTKPEIL
jgi:hypothetical protein